MLDYATGSGHMLIGAARRLAHHLARIRTGDDEPGPDHVRSALRDVVRHCIYGVDVNETSVELCKVALWMETLEPGKPLGFLDAHIRHGNSLIGVTSLDDLDAGIPDAAFSAKTGDDKAAASALKKRNKKEREGLQAGLFETHPEDDLLKEWRDFQAAPEETPQQIAAKTAAYDTLRREGGRWDQLRTACHLWTAAFFAEYTGDKRTDERIATTADLRANLAQPQTASREQAAYARELAKRHAFFHWSLAFPEVYRQGGFDVILSNPPWEQIQVDAREFFAASAPAIAEAPTMAVRNRMIKELQESDPSLYSAFQASAHGNDAVKKFVHDSRRFPYTSFGRLNLAPLFAELASQLVSPSGRSGIIVPTGIATDSFNQYFFNYLVDESTLVSLFDFENRRAIFPGVHRSYKFCLLTLTGDANPVEASEYAFFALDPADLRDPQRSFTLTPEDIALVNPNTRTVPIFRTRRDAELTKSIYRRIPVLIRDEVKDENGRIVRDEENPWGIKFKLMFMMNTDSHLFRTREQLEADGWRLEGNVFVGSGSREIGSREVGAEGSGERYLPLYEAKMMHHFDHRWATYENGSTRDLTLAQKNDPTCVVLPRYWVSETETINRLTQVPPELVTAYNVHSETLASQALAMWIGSYWQNRGNPAVADWAFDRYMKHISLSATMFDALEAVIGRQTIGRLEERYPLTEADLELVTRYADDGVLKIAEALIQAKTPKWLIGFRDVCRSTDERTAIFSFIPRTSVGHKAPLILATDPLSAINVSGPSFTFAFDYVTRQSIGGTSLSYFILKQLPIIPPEVYDQPCPWAGAPADSAPTPYSPLPTPPPFRWDEERRFLLRCELDAAYFHLYGIERDDVAYILETFPIVKRKDIAAHGDYRTQRVILEIYDEMAEAMRTGVAYRTRLDPPPADPRLAHRPKGVGR